MIPEIINNINTIFHKWNYFLTISSPDNKTNYINTITMYATNFRFLPCIITVNHFY